jgi:putative intracellular protease/amidase
MAAQIQGRKIAILVTDGFEYVELVKPRKALDDAGAKTSIVSPKTDHVRSWNFTDWATNCRLTCRSTAPALLILTHCCSPAA